MWCGVARGGGQRISQGSKQQRATERATMQRLTLKLITCVPACACHAGYIEIIDGAAPGRRIRPFIQMCLLWPIGWFHIQYSQFTALHRSLFTVSLHFPGDGDVGG